MGSITSTIDKYMRDSVMKWRYAITYGSMKPGTTMPQIEKEMAKYKAEVEKTGVKLVFWGHPFGVSEDMFTLYDLGGNMDNYIKVAELSPPFSGSRTDFILEH
jgi:hypothetical protein